MLAATLELLHKLKWRQTLGWKGMLAYDRHLKRIVQAPPTPQLTDERAELHIITSKKDFFGALWGLWSFYHFSEERYQLCIHEDGSLGDEEVEICQRLFPGCRVIRAAEAERAVIPWLADWPRCQLLRKTKFISMKEFDFNYYLEAPVGVLFDSDLIFYRRPDFVCDDLIAQRRAGNWVNADMQPGLSMPVADMKRKFGVDVPERYNTGFGTWHAGTIRNPDMETFLADLQVLDHPWRFEQTLHALCSGKTEARLLPEAYDVYFGSLKANPVMRHYVGAIRHQMYSEGVARLSGEW